MNCFSIVAMGSGQASTIDFFCQKINEKNPSFQIQALITENPKSGIIKVSQKFHLPCHIIEYKNKNFKEWDKKLCQTLLIYQPDIILLAGFLKKIGPEVLKTFKNKIINSHPSLLPEFSGFKMYGSKVHEAVIQKRKKYTGVSIHVVNENYDEGPVISQKKISVDVKSASELEKKVKKIEKKFYFQVVEQITRGQIFLP